jgi:hypothetical protein
MARMSTDKLKSGEIITLTKTGKDKYELNKM